MYPRFIIPIGIIIIITLKFIIILNKNYKNDLIITTTNSYHVLAISYNNNLIINNFL